MFKTIVLIIIITISISGGYCFIFQGNAIGNDEVTQKNHNETNGAVIDTAKQQYGLIENKSLNCDDVLIDPYKEFYDDTTGGLNLSDTKEVTILFSNNSEYRNLIAILKNKSIPIFTKGDDFLLIVWEKTIIDRLVNYIEAKNIETREAEEKDFQMRLVRGQVPEGCSHSKALDIMSDVWPDSYTYPFIVGRAFDYQIDILRNAGIDIRIESKPEIIPKKKSENQNIIDVQ